LYYIANGDWYLLDCLGAGAVESLIRVLEVDTGIQRRNLARRLEGIRGKTLWEDPAGWRVW
jgi:hypothetical protein